MNFMMFLLIIIGDLAISIVIFSISGHSDKSLIISSCLCILYNIFVYLLGKD